MLIAIVTGGLPCNGNSLKTGSLGGSETALISVAQALAKRGHEVRVFCECDAPGVYDGVQYYRKEAFAQNCALSSVDVLIASRWFQYLALPIACGLRVLWLHDILVNKDELMGGLFQTDLVMPLSDFHVENYCEKLPEIRKIVWKTKNGVDLNLIGKCKRPKVSGKLMFTSRPERGLDFLLRDILPKILQRRPDAKLYYANYDTTAMGVPPYVQKTLELCEQLSRANPNHVVPMGHLNKEALYQQMSTAQVQLFPSAFPEIFCISAIEAQACGTAVVATDNFAFRETVGKDSGKLISGLPTDEQYQWDFANAVCDYLDNQDALQAAQDAGPVFVADNGFCWDKIAEDWETKFSEMLEVRWQKNKVAVLQQLEHSNDLMAALLLARKEGLTEVADRLDVECKAATEPRSIESTPAEDFQKAMPLFQRLLELMRFRNLNPQRIFDVAANDVCFGLVLAKNYPNAHVTVRAVCDATASRISQYASASKLENVTVLKPSDSVLGPTDKQFDFMFFGDVLDECVSPSAELIRMQNLYLDNGGNVLATTRYGSRSNTKYSDRNRLWNIDFGDLRSMFLGVCNFDASFHDEAISDRGELVGHWAWIFQKNTNIRSVDITEKRKRTRPYQSLAFCLITKNESKWLKGCLESVRQIADHVVVCDTGSTDETCEIAARMGAELRHVKFDNFAQARNASIENVDADWIFWIDSDERLAGPDNVRKYLHTQLFEGFGIRQNHLMLDIAKSFDVPVRLLRNRQYHRFTGLIHEHCERVDRQPFDDPIHPVLVLPDVDIVHYGYMNERVRRQKCSNRNMELLIRDVKESAPAGRMLTWVLVIRDYLNFVKWDMERTQGRIASGSRSHELLCAAVTTFRAKFGDGKHRYYPIAAPMYQEALQYLGKNGLCYLQQPPPFEVGLALTGAFGGLEDGNVVAQSIWFLDMDECMLHLKSKGVELARKLGADPEKYPAVPFAVGTSEELPDPVRLLSTGLNVIPKRMA